MNFLRNNILSLLISVLIAVSSFTSSDSINRINFLHLKNIDKSVHFLMYFGLTITILFENRKRIKNKLNYMPVIFVTFLYGFIIEILQPVITNSRSKESMDMLFNFAGIIIAVIIWHLIRVLYSKNL